MLYKVDVALLTIDSNQNIPIIILKQNHGTKTLPIAIDAHEASLLALHSLQMSSQRPSSIDLFIMFMKQVKGVLEKVVIADIIDQMFYAHLYITTEKSIHILDCKPSDAILLALRSHCSIYVDEHVFNKIYPPAEQSEIEILRQNISQTDTINFGQYYLS